MDAYILMIPQTGTLYDGPNKHQPTAKLITIRRGGSGDDVGRATIKAHPTTPHHPRPYGILGWHLQGIHPGILLCTRQRYLYSRLLDGDIQLTIYSAYMYLAMLGNACQQDT
jgi:hypothetical protein